MMSAEGEAQLAGLITNVTKAITNMRIYSENHPQAQQYLDQAHADLGQYLRGREGITFLRVVDQLVFDQRPLPRSEPRFRFFAQSLQRLGIESMTFLAGVTRQELQEVLRDFTRSEHTHINSTAHIKLGRIASATGPSEPGSTEGLTAPPHLVSLAAMRHELAGRIEDVKEMCEQISRQKPVDTNSIERMVTAFVHALSRGHGPFQMLASIKSADEYTFTHVVNVCILTMSQAQSLGFKEEQLYQIGIAAALHDAGKLFVPPEIIGKPGALTPEERAIMESHAVKGARYILDLEDAPRLSVLSALEHHIRYDGTGYPRLNADWRPHFVSQMIAISDVFDAMRSRRCYREPKPQAEIIDILRKEKGTSFNPLLVDNFLHVLKR